MERIDYFCARVIVKITGIVFVTQLIFEVSGIATRKHGFEWVIYAGAGAFGASLLYAAALILINAWRSRVVDDAQRKGKGQAAPRHHKRKSEMTTTNELEQKPRSGLSDLTVVLGCAVHFLNDGKGKWQSHEASITKYIGRQLIGANGGGYADFSATGYGETKEKALVDLREVVALMMAT